MGRCRDYLRGKTPPRDKIRQFAFGPMHACLTCRSFVRHQIPSIRKSATFHMLVPTLSLSLASHRCRSARINFHVSVQRVCRYGVIDFGGSLVTAQTIFQHSIITVTVPRLRSTQKWDLGTEIAIDSSQRVIFDDHGAYTCHTSSKTDFTSCPVTFQDQVKPVVDVAVGGQGPVI